MPPKKNSRAKRLVLDSKHQLKGLWFAEKGQLLRLTYDYSKSASEDPVYKELIEVAVENFNKLGLARLKYQPYEMGIHFKNCPFDVQNIKSKHKNPIIFAKSDAKDTGKVCSMQKIPLYDYRFTAFLLDGSAGDNITLPPFAKISCNTGHRNFLRNGIGVILHEINHLFGIQHTHMLEDTNGILMVNITKPRLNKIKKGEVEKFFSLYSYVDYSQVVNYTLVSPFSIQHYKIRALEPYRVLNISRIKELLDAYQMPDDMQADYFHLLKNYGPFLYTYQDIVTLATAIYRIAPESLMEMSYDFPRSYFIEGLYIPAADKIKLERIIDALYYAENFHYPILAKETITLKIKTSSPFKIKLNEKLMVVKFSKNDLSCSLKGESTFFFSNNLILQPDCLLSGQINSPGRFNFSILLSEGSASIIRYITVVVKENSKLKNRVLLGQKQVIHYLDGNHYTDLLKVCQAVALPQGKELSCQLADNHLAESAHFTKCWFWLKEKSNNKNLTFIISNEEANKTCNIQFIFDDPLNLTTQSTLVNLSDEALLRFNEMQMGYYDDEVSYLQHHGGPYLQNQTKLNQSNQVFSSLTLQLNYCLTIPFLHGVIEGAIDSYSCHPYLKGSLKLLPRIGLWYFNYLSPIYFTLLGFVWIIEGFIKKNLSNLLNKSAEKIICLCLFLAVTELEYGFSNLWQLTDRLCFWPGLTDKLNQLFLQLMFVPLIKTLGYELSIYLMEYITGATAQEKECIKVKSPLVTNDCSILKNAAPLKAMSFFTAFRVASQSVFSRKIMRLFSFFSNTKRSSGMEVNNAKRLIALVANH